MKTFSLKGLGAGILAAGVLAIPLSFLSGHYIVAIYNDLAPGVNFANEMEAERFTYRVLSHPLTIAYGLITTLIGVGIPAYISAWVAGRSFVQHSLVIGGILSLFGLVEWEVVSQFPVMFSLLIVLSLAVAYAAGVLRKRQVDNVV